MNYTVNDQYTIDVLPRYIDLYMNWSIDMYTSIYGII
jgi:hypothetical protein